MEFSVEPVIKAIREHVTDVQGIGLHFVEDFKVREGKNGKKGHVLVQMRTNMNIGLDIDIDFNEAFRNPQYLDTLIPDIHKALDAALEARQECQRMVY